PRILDVPEELEAFPTTPFLDGLQFGPGTQPVAATHADSVELPFRAAARAHRFYAALLDGGIVVAASGIFAAVGFKMLPGLTLTKPLLWTAAALPALLWAVYQYLLLVYGGATAGMRIAKIRLSTFKGEAPRRRERRQRVLALYFSMASFVMGLLWAFVDVDALCWHDRISRTYLTNRVAGD
ncbi:MAG: RDD family protein, partial [Candidatus Korobacteraceae bacterium]